MKRLEIWYLSLAILILIAYCIGCQSGDGTTPTPAPTSIPVITSASTPAPTSIPAITSTPAPAPTPAPPPTPTPAPDNRALYLPTPTHQWIPALPIPPPTPTPPLSPTPTPQTIYLTPTPVPITLTIQPNPANGKDAAVDQFYGNVTNNVSAKLRVGASEPGRVHRPYFQFDISEIPGNASILEAELGLYHKWSQPPLYSESLSTDVGVYKVTSDWDEYTITWNNQPTSEVAPVDIRNMPAAASNDFIYWSVTELVEGWLDDTTTNYGVVFRDIDESTLEGNKQVLSSDWLDPTEWRPKLIIRYYLW